MKKPKDNNIQEKRWEGRSKEQQRAEVKWMTELLKCLMLFITRK